VEVGEAALALDVLDLQLDLLVAVFSSLILDVRDVELRDTSLETLRLGLETLYVVQFSSCLLDSTLRTTNITVLNYVSPIANNFYIPEKKLFSS